MKRIPTPDGAVNFRALVALTGATYTVYWRWNQRASQWFFSMDSPSGDRVVSGVPVVLNVDLLDWVPFTVDRPPYPIFVIDATGALDEPTLDTLGTRVRAIYAEPGE